MKMRNVQTSKRPNIPRGRPCVRYCANPCLPLRFTNAPALALRSSSFAAPWCFSVLVVLLPSIALAQSGNGYDLTWSTIDSGGEMFSAGNGYELGGTIGQADAGAMSGGAYELSGGFWVASAVDSGLPCVTVQDCASDLPNNACNHATCPGGNCVYSCVRFGDVQTPPNGLVNLDDILCVLAGFANFSTCINGDIHPCGGNGLVNLDDILAVLGAFSGANPCACTENTAPGTGASPVCGSNQP